MEDDPKQLKVEYLSNHLLEHTKDLSLDDQAIFNKSLKLRRPPMEGANRTSKRVEFDL